MNHLVKLILVAALALMFVPYCLANEWVPDDTIKALQLPAFQLDRFALKHIPNHWNADISANIGKSGRWGVNPPAQGSSLNDWLPVDGSGMWLLPYYR